MARIISPNAAADLSTFVDISQLSNRRFTMQSLADASFVQGFIGVANDRKCTIQVTSQKNPREGMFYYTEVTGIRNLFTFVGFTDNCTSNSAVLNLSSDISFRVLAVEVRAPIRKVEGKVSVDDEVDIVRIQDGSDTQVGFESDYPLSVDSSAELTMDSPHGLINSLVQICDCSRSGLNTRSYIIVAKFVHLDRVSQARWQKLLGQG